MSHEDVVGRWSHTRIGDYQVGNWRGDGNYAEVYLAKDVHTQQTVAIKIARNSLQSNVSVDPNAGTIPASSKDPENFKKEAQTLASLNHPHIIKLLAYGVTMDGNPYLVMPYIE